ncbi:hypothetical protein [Desertibacillus haloalkaliphilus]|uniref:hypothetical protein n=1 Tax=Desertibacillus haloalkaliphilus TaxID=1328930 RepID=UPI001C25ACE5|nr:hypothetical protein [Desertibacillus haloalkaliphilus]MBU8907595.1 hypothetical protein [Desertibacillus haloalkaliphilus]
MKLLLLDNGFEHNDHLLSYQAQTAPYTKNLPTKTGNKQSMIEHICNKLKKLDLLDQSYIVTTKQHIKRMDDKSITPTEIITLPATQSSFSKVLLACSYLYSETDCSTNEMIAVINLHSFTDLDYSCLSRLAQALEKSKADIGLLGLETKRPSITDDYMQMHPKKNSSTTIFHVQALSRPDTHETAYKHFSQGDLCYSGISMFRLKSMIKQLKRQHLPQTYKQLLSTRDKIKHSRLEDELITEETNVIAVPYHGEWRKLTEDLSHLSNRSMFEERRWGWYEVLSYYFSGTEQILVKRIHVYAGENISYQLHQHRKEIWTITDGLGLFAYNQTLQPIQQGDVLKISQGAEHAVKALTDLDMIEVQMGTDLREEDITRIYMNWDDIEANCKKGF